jgi:hypothetical protein
MEQSCMEMLVQNRDMLEKLATTLIERETMDENDLMQLFNNLKKENCDENEKSNCTVSGDINNCDSNVGV